MVLRLFRRGICRPNKFRRPKHNALLDRLKGTVSDGQKDEVARCKRCQGVNGSLGTQFSSPNNFKRPTLHIAHSTLFATDKGDDKDSLTLLESLRQRLASHNINVDEPLTPNEAKEEDILHETEEEEERNFSKDTVQVEETVHDTPISDADNAKDPEPLREIDDARRSVFDPPHIKSYTRYHQQTEQQNEAEMFDELARKYLVTEKGDIDKGLSQDMERLGLPVNTDEAMRPPVNVYVSGDEEFREEYAPKPKDSAKAEAPVDESPSYYENANWCDNYFKNTPLRIACTNKEAEEMADKYRRDALHNDMLPLNWCYDSYFELEKSKEDSNVSKLQFDKHDDMLPFHLLQCTEFIDLDLSIKTDPVESSIPDLKVEENQPTHFSLQGDLSDRIPTSPITAGELSEPIISMINTSMIQDSDVTKFEYVYSRDYCDLQSTLYEHNEPLDEQQTEVQAMKEATPPTESSDTILQIQSQTMLRTQNEQSSEQAEPSHHTYTAGAKIYGQGAYQTTNETAQPTFPTEQVQKPEQVIPIENQTTNETGVNILQMKSQPRLPTEQVQKPDEVNPVENIIHAKVLEQMHEQSSEQAEPSHHTYTAGSKVYEQGTYQTTNETAQPTYPTEQIQKPDEVNPVENIIQANVLEQMQGTTAPQNIETSKKSDQITNIQSQDATYLTQNTVNPEHFTKSKRVANTTEQIDVSGTTKDSPPISQDARVVFDKAPTKPIDTTQTMKDSPQTSRESQAIVQSPNQAQAEQTNASRTTVESLQGSQERQAIVQSYTQAHEKRIDMSQTIKYLPYTKQIQAIIENSDQAQEVAKSLKAQNTAQPENLAHTIPVGPKVAKKADITAEEIQPTRGSEAMAQSCVQAQTAGSEATKTAQPDPLANITKSIDDAFKKLNLDSNLSLSELLRRVRTRNRLQYYHDIRTQLMSSMSNLQTKCPTDRPVAPCPPDCVKPCAPPPKKPKKDKNECPKPKETDCPPTAKPNAKKCPKKKQKKHKKCPPDPPQCPAKPKCPPCPSPPPPTCPPEPPKCPCQVTDDSVIPLCLFESTTSHLKHLTGIINEKVLESRDRFFPTCSADPSLEKLETDSLKLNRVKDFEPWTPIPSWPFPVHDKRRRLQCPYHGCPYHKPGPVRPNCPELPCVHYGAALFARGFCKSEWMKPKFVNKPYSERHELPLFVQTTRGHDKVRYGELGRQVRKSHNDLSKIFAKNGNVQRIFASLGLCDTEGTKTDSTDTKCNLNDGKSKRHEVEAIIQTYSELKALTTPHVKKSNSLAEVQSAIEAATLNATTAHIDEDEKLKQKLETIEEVPLVEADPDIIKPPRASGPNVMNFTELKNCEEYAQHSDFQIGEDRVEPELVYNQATIEAAPNYIKHYFESKKEEDPTQKPNLNEMVTLNAVPEINAEEELSLKELMERVRQRNRLLRCCDIGQQLKATAITMDNKNKPQQPQRSAPTIQPGWGWPNTQNPPGYARPMYPYVSNPSPQKAEPITPDNRPGYYRSTKVSPINLALHLGPLVNAFKNAGILFPLLMVAYLFPKRGTSAGSEGPQRNLGSVQCSFFEREAEDQSSDISEAHD